MGRKPIERMNGDLRPVYRLFQHLLPRHRACSSKVMLAWELTQILFEGRKVAIQMPNLERELGAGTAKRPRTVHPDYFTAFKTLFGLEALGVTDDMLLNPDEKEREDLLRAAMWQRGFDWLSQQEREEDRGRLQMTPLPGAAGDDDPLGPNTTTFEPLPLDLEDGVPIGRRFKFVIDMPWEGYATILSQDPVLIKVGETISRPTYCLDPLTGALHRQWPAGKSILPGELRMDPPVGLTRTVLVTSPIRFEVPWDPNRLRHLAPDELGRFIGMLAARGGDGFRISRLDYHVIE